MLRIGLFDLLRKLPAIKNKEAELQEIDKKINWAVKRYEELDEHHKQLVHNNGFASAFVKKEGNHYAR